MMRQIARGIRGRVRKFASRPYRQSYSQSGEDLILQYACNAIGRPCPSYLDIGAHDPIRLSNTYLFYRQGASGVLVEPNPKLARILATKRPRDRVVRCAIGPERQENAEFIVCSPSHLSTLSMSEAEKSCRVQGVKVVEVVRTEVLTFEEIVSREFRGSMPDIVSMDVEGIDESIVKSTNWQKVRPSIICIETREFAPNWQGRRVVEIDDVLCSSGYDVFGKTYLNTIYIDRSRFEFS